MFDIYILQSSSDPIWERLASFQTLSEAVGVASLALGRFHLWCVLVLPPGSREASIVRDDPHWIKDSMHPLAIAARKALRDG
jgi:hypothetical protein